MTSQAPHPTPSGDGELRERINAALPSYFDSGDVELVVTLIEQECAARYESGVRDAFRAITDVERLHLFEDYTEVLAQLQAQQPYPGSPGNGQAQKGGQHE